MSLFEGAIAQYIDANGKTRLLNYKQSGRTVSLMTSPLPPFDLPSTTIIRNTPIAIASAFIKEKNLEVVRQTLLSPSNDNDSEGQGQGEQPLPQSSQSTPIIKGLWVASKESISPVYYAYIPIQPSTPIPGVEFADENTRNPLQPSERDTNISLLEEFRRNRKTADYLKQYTLYAYSLNPETFGENSFEVIDGYTYDLEAINRRLSSSNDVMFNRRGQLKVPSIEVRDKLLNYLKVQLITDSPTVLDYSLRTNIDDYYQSIYDFRTSNSQLVFINKESLMRWKLETLSQTSRNVVGKKLLPEAIEPYYYRNTNLRRNRLAIIQNVRGGDLKDALEVSKGWINDQLNMGYSVNSSIDPATAHYVEYSEDALNEPPVTHGNRKGNELLGSVIKYSNGTYGALLFI